MVAIAREPATLDIIDTVSLTRSKSIPMNGRLHNTYITPDGSTKRIFAQHSNLNGFSVIDFAQRMEVARITLPNEPNGYAPEHRQSSPSHGIGVAPNGKTLWVTSIPANAVFVYSLPDIELQGYVSLPLKNIAGRDKPIPAVPNWVTFTPDSKQVYISNAAAVAFIAANSTNEMETATPRRADVMVTPPWCSLSEPDPTLANAL